MKVGSLVECINGNPQGCLPDEIIPKEGFIYTVRSICKKKRGKFLRFDEIGNKARQHGIEFGECCWGANGFCEVQPPMNVSEIFADQLKVNKTDSKTIKVHKATKK